MDANIALAFCLYDDLLKWQHHRDAPQCVLSDAEIMTITIVATNPVVVCNNYRIRRCKLYRDEAYRGDQASKKRYLYSLKIHLVVTKAGQPAGFFLSPSAFSDTAALDQFDFDPPPGRVCNDCLRVAQSPASCTVTESERVSRPARL